MKTLLLAVTMLVSAFSIAQSGMDTLVWNDGTVYYGKLEKKGRAEIQFRTQDGQMHYIGSSSVASVRLADGSGDALTKVEPKDTAGQAQREARKAARHAEIDSLKQAEAEANPTVDWSDPTIPKSTLRKHRTGIALTVVGSTLLGAGIAMLTLGIAKNGQTNTTSNAYSAQTTVSVGPVGFAGILSLVAGVPMLIVGAVKAGKAKNLALAHQKLR
ncbi:MAG: hypothetical protein JSS76_11635 [Bacteroidetes bacterium]|nr:hypothetical protein [Bacteroidota bacterium]